MQFSVFQLPCYREAFAPTLTQFYEESIETVRSPSGSAGTAPGARSTISTTTAARCPTRR